MLSNGFKKSAYVLSTLTLAVIALFSLQSFTFVNDDSQPIEFPGRCGTDEIHKLNLEIDEEYKRSYDQILKKLGEVESTPSPRSLSNETYTIPVVVHVFHDGDVIGEGSNISDEIIYDAIDALNADFMGESFFPAQNTGAPFFNDPVDIDIEFCLATIDPDGNPTNGITRQNPDSLAGYTQSGMVTTSNLAESAETNLKSLCYWPVAEYCNIYVVHKLNGGSSPLGFAYLPPISSLRDGIVVYRGVFGFNNNGNQSNGTLVNNYDENKTLTHEMGHYLGLYHTFNNTNECTPTNTNCVSQGDRLCDTPPTTGSVNCSPLSCYETMTENFMDYSRDGCMDRFSPDGRTRMRDKLITLRSGLLDNGNCLAIDGIDVGASNITLPNISECTEVYEGITVGVYSSSFTTINSIDIIYSLDDGVNSSGMFTWYGELEFGENITIELPALDVPYGEHTLEVYAYNPNLIPDAYPNNDGASISFNNIPGSNVDIEVQLDALPYGFNWVLSNLETGEVIFESEPYTNSEFACQSVTYSFCLPEGEYEVLCEDLFGNGQFYPCNSNGGVGGSLTIIYEEDIVGIAFDNWGSEELLLFYIGPPPVECPTYSCRLDLDDNGAVGVSDVLSVLNIYGYEVEPCTRADFNDDGAIGVDDVLDILSMFGLICNTEVIENAEIPQSLKEEVERITGISLMTGIEEPVFPLPININVNQLESMQDVYKVMYYDIAGRQVNKQNVRQGIYIANIFLVDGRMETIKFYQD